MQRSQTLGIFPNSTNKQFTIDWPQQNGAAQISVYDPNGKVFLQKPDLNAEGLTVSVE